MHPDRKGAEIAEARRQFLARCGRFAAATPPAISLLLAASHANYAVASSGSGGTNGSGGGIQGNGAMNASDVNTNTTTTQGGSTAGRSCGNAFDALFNNDKCIR